MTGKVHSIQTMGTLDGPGVRFVLFMQGCNLRCKCCHNPDTWSISGGTEYSPCDILNKLIRYREYFGDEGGITLSGGEPLLQAEFAYELFKLCHKENINTCLDTSGSIFNDDIKKLLSVTDRVLLDIKYTDDNSYKENVGCSIEPVLKFLLYLDKCNIPTTLRQVIIPGFNDNEENMLKIKEYASHHKCVDKIELLPFRKICQTKYDNMNLIFPFANINEPDINTMNKLKELISEYI